MLNIDGVTPKPKEKAISPVREGVRMGRECFFKMKVCPEEYKGQHL